MVLEKSELFITFALHKIPGEVSEWLKEHAWKVCIGLKLIAGSNPALSTKELKS